MFPDADDDNRTCEQESCPSYCRLGKCLFILYFTYKIEKYPNSKDKSENRGFRVGEKYCREKKKRSDPYSGHHDFFTL